MPYQSVFRLGLFEGQSIIVTGGGSASAHACDIREEAQVGRREEERWPLKPRCESIIR
jgi:hypothetical protein